MASVMMECGVHNHFKIEVVPRKKDDGYIVTASTFSGPQALKFLGWEGIGSKSGGRNADGDTAPYIQVLRAGLGDCGHRMEFGLDVIGGTDPYSSQYYKYANGLSTQTSSLDLSGEVAQEGDDLLEADDAFGGWGLGTRRVCEPFGKFCFTCNCILIFREWARYVYPFIKCVTVHQLSMHLTRHHGVSYSVEHVKTHWDRRVRAWGELITYSFYRGSSRLLVSPYRKFLFKLEIHVHVCLLCSTQYIGLSIIQRTSQ